MYQVLREIEVKNILVKSGIPGATYCLNPYVGCEHACRYCYARFMKRFSKHEEKWGSFVDVKINAAHLLRKIIFRAKRGEVLLSSVCDPYQPLEKKYELTRACLEILLQNDFPVSILTKSSLVVRDIDLFLSFSQCEVGLTVTTDNERMRRIFEPNASTIKERVEALAKLHRSGVKTYAFIGPILPQNPEKLANMLVGKVNWIMVDKMNYPWLVKNLYQKLRIGYALTEDYFEEVKQILREIFRKNQIQFEVV